MPIIPLYGHDELRARLLPRIVAGTLPQSLLLHGPAGVGKQRLALWMAQALLCTSDAPPCGKCRECRYALDLTHPDLTWVFPRPRPKGGDDDPDDIAEDLARPAKSASRNTACTRRRPATKAFTSRRCASSSGRHRARRRWRVARSSSLATSIAWRSRKARKSRPTRSSSCSRSRQRTRGSSPRPVPSVRSCRRFVPASLAFAYRDWMTPRCARSWPIHAVVEVLAKAEIPSSERERLVLAQGAPGALLSSGVRKNGRR